MLERAGDSAWASSKKSKKTLMASRHPPRTRRNQWHKESAEKTLKKKPMASRIGREDIPQQEETNGVKNLPRRSPAAKRKPRLQDTS